MSGIIGNHRLNVRIVPKAFNGRSLALVSLNDIPVMTWMQRDDGLFESISSFGFDQPHVVALDGTWQPQIVGARDTECLPVALGELELASQHAIRAMFDNALDATIILHRESADVMLGDTRLFGWFFGDMEPEGEACCFADDDRYGGYYLVGDNINYWHFEHQDGCDEHFIDRSASTIVDATPFAIRAWKQFLVKYF